MATFPLQFIDGDYSTARPVYAQPARSWPFEGNDVPDLYPVSVRRRFIADPRSAYKRIATRTAYTNLLTYSEDFANAAWTKTNSTTTAAQLANPCDGTSTFSKMLETATTAEHRIERAYTFTAAAYTFSALVSAGLGRDFVRLLTYDGTTFRSAIFDLANGQVSGTPSGCTAAIRRYQSPAGVVSFRISITFTPAAAAGSVYLNAASDASTVSYLGDITKGIYCGGVQLELASSVGPYVVTTSASRSVSVPDVDGFANSGALDTDDFAFLCSESTVDAESTTPAPISRTYCRVPATQYAPDSYLFARPSLHNFKSSNIYAISFDDNASAHLFYPGSRNACTALPVVGGTYVNYTVIHKAGHGLSVGDRLAVWGGEKFIGDCVVTGIYGVDDFYIDVLSTSGAGITYYAAKGAASYRVACGPIDCSARRVRYFYLPGWTAGIATRADVPNFTPAIDAVSWLAQIISYLASPSANTYGIGRTDNLKQYAGPILEKSIMEFQVSDALVLLDVNA